MLEIAAINQNLHELTNDFEEPSLFLQEVKGCHETSNTFLVQILQVAHFLHHNIVGTRSFSCDNINAAPILRMDVFSSTASLAQFFPQLHPTPFYLGGVPLSPLGMASPRQEFRCYAVRTARVKCPSLPVVAWFGNRMLL